MQRYRDLLTSGIDVLFDTDTSLEKRWRDLPRGRKVTGTGDGRAPSLEAKAYQRRSMLTAEGAAGEVFGVFNASFPAVVDGPASAPRLRVLQAPGVIDASVDPITSWALPDGSRNVAPGSTGVLLVGSDADGERRIFHPDTTISLITHWRPNQPPTKSTRLYDMDGDQTGLSARLSTGFMVVHKPSGQRGAWNPNEGSLALNAVGTDYQDGAGFPVAFDSVYTGQFDIAYGARSLGGAFRPDTTNDHLIGHDAEGRRHVPLILDREQAKFGPTPPKPGGGQWPAAPLDFRNEMAQSTNYTVPPSASAPIMYQDPQGRTVTLDVLPYIVRGFLRYDNNEFHQGPNGMVRGRWVIDTQTLWLAPNIYAPPPAPPSPPPVPRPPITGGGGGGPGPGPGPGGGPGGGPGPGGGGGGGGGGPGAGPGPGPGPGGGGPPNPAPGRADKKDGKDESSEGPPPGVPEGLWRELQRLLKARAAAMKRGQSGWVKYYDRRLRKTVGEMWKYKKRYEEEQRRREHRHSEEERKRRARAEWEKRKKEIETERKNAAATVGTVPTVNGFIQSMVTSAVNRFRDDTHLTDAELIEAREIDAAMATLQEQELEENGAAEYQRRQQRVLERARSQVAAASLAAVAPDNQAPGIDESPERENAFNKQGGAASAATVLGAYTHNEVALPSIHFAVPNPKDKDAAILYSGALTAEQMKAMLAWPMSTLRMVGFGNTNHRRANPTENRMREVVEGGIVLAGADLRPEDVYSEAGITSVCDPTFLLRPEVTFAMGTPSQDGTVRSGMTMVLTSAAQVDVDFKDSTGASTTGRVNVDGIIQATADAKVPASANPNSEPSTTSSTFWADNGSLSGNPNPSPMFGASRLALYSEIGGGVTFPIQAPDDSVANYAFDAGTTPGSENAGMGFVSGDEGPSLFDIDAGVQLKVSTAGVQIPNKLTVGGFIDPTGIGFTPDTARPAGATTLGNGIWAKEYTATNTLRALRWYDSAFDQLLMAGGFTRIRSAFTATATLTAQDMGALVPVTASVANIVASLPAAANVPAGSAIAFVRTDQSGYTVTVARSGADTINLNTGPWSLLESQNSGQTRHVVKFVSDGVSNWTPISSPLITSAGIIPVVAGGTGQGLYVQGDILYASSATTLAALNKNTSATRYLSNTGASNNPAWAQVNVANGVTGTLPLGNGGTGGTTADTANASLAGGTARSNNTSARHLGYDGTNGGYFTNTELFDNVQHLTQKTSVTDGFKFLVVDESGNSGYVNFEDIDPTGVKLIARTVSYSGSGSSGKTVTLTGINRAHAIFVKRDNSTSYGTQDFMLGATGAFNLRHVNDTGSYGCSLDAAAAGTSQTLTINSTNADVNSSGVTYKILVFGSSI